MELANDKHQVVTLVTGIADSPVDAAERVIIRDSWHELTPYAPPWGIVQLWERNVRYLSLTRYTELIMQGQDLSQSRLWSKYVLCIHFDCESHDDCVYCEMRCHNPEVELEKIQAALLSYSGTLAEREKKVLEDFRCGSSGVKPAKS